MLKLDRPEWDGLSAYEATVLFDLAEAGLPVGRPHGTVTVDGRAGVILDRVEGPSLLEVLLASGPDEVERLADRFAALQLECNHVSVGGLPDLVSRLGDEIDVSVPDPGLRRDLQTLLAEHDDGERASATSISTRPTCWSVRRLGRHRLADRGGRPLGGGSRPHPRPVGAAFDRAGRALHACRAARGSVPTRPGRRCPRCLGAGHAAARVAEGFEGSERAWLLRVAGGSERLFA